MKTVFISLLLAMLCSALLAQTAVPPQSNPEPRGEKKAVPKLNPESTDSLPLALRPPLKPEVQIIPQPWSENDTPDPFRMPVATTPEFHSNMPIKVPDSTVHYFIQQAIPVQPFPKKK